MLLPGGLNRFVLPKLAAAAAVAAFVVWRTPRSGAMPLPLRVLVSAAVLALTAAALVGDGSLTALLGRAPRYEGLVAIGPYLLMLLVGTWLLGTGRSPDLESTLVRALAGAALLVGALALAESAGWRPLESSVARPGSMFGNATDQGAWALLASGPVVAYALATRDRLAVVGVGALAVALVTAGSRAALVGAVAVAVVLGVTMARRGLRVALGGGLAGLLACALALPATRERLLGGSPLSGSTVSGRRSLWAESLQLVADHPVLGVGPSGFFDALPRYHQPSWYASYGTVNPPDSPHNVLLQIGAAGGLLLLALTLCLVTVVAVLGWQRLRTAPTPTAHALQAGWLAGLAGYVVVLQTTPTSTGPMLLAALFAGGAVAVEADAPRRSVRWGLLAVTTAGAAVLIAAASAEIPLRHAVVAAADGDAARAQDAFRLAHRLRPWDIEVPLAAGHSMSVLSSPSDPRAIAWAGQWLETAHARLPNSQQVLLDLAGVREVEGQLPTSEWLLDAATGLAPNDPDVLLRRGVVRAERSHYAGAEADFVRVTKIAPHDAAAWQNLTELYRLQGDTKRADRAARVAARLS